MKHDWSSELLMHHSSCLYCDTLFVKLVPGVTNGNEDEECPKRGREKPPRGHVSYEDQEFYDRVKAVKETTPQTALHRDTVFLTRAHQRILNRALRRSSRLID